MQTTIIRDWAAFDRLESEWNELLFRSQASSIFLTWEWISAWRAAVSDSVSPFVIIVRDESDELIGVAPLYLSSMRFLKVLRYRMLRYMADVATGSEYPDWIVHKDREEVVSAAITDCLISGSGSWDTLWLPRIAGWTGARERLLNAPARRFLRCRIRTNVFSKFDLGPTLESYEQSLSANRRQQLRRNTRRIEAIEGIEFDTCETAESLPEFLEALFELHQLRWQADGKEGTFRRKPAEERFYRNFVPQALRQGWLAFFGLRHKNILKAVQIGYVFDNTYYQLQEGFDPEFAAGAGNWLRHRGIAHLIDQGVEAYDFLGGWSEHKRRWGATRRDGYDLFVAARKLRTLPIFVFDVWPSGRLIDASQKNSHASCLSLLQRGGE